MIRGVAALLLGLLAACGTAPESRPVGSALSGPGASEAATCEQRCNHSYEACEDSTAAGRDSAGLAFGANSLFGSDARCRRLFQACLPGCREAARPVPAAGPAQTPAP